MKKIILFISLVTLLVACQATPSARPTIEESVSIILTEYSQDLSNESIANDSLYSLPMKALLEERKSFYKEFFLMALHSDLTSISSTYDIRSISQDINQENTFIVEAAEVIDFKAKYRVEPGGHPLINAAKWAIAHTENLDIRKRLQEYSAMYETETRKHATDGFETDFVVEHTLIVLTETNNFQIVQDAYTDANPQDNPMGTDVIEWENGTFTRKKPDYMSYPDYYIYHVGVEELGKNLLNDYSK